MYANRQGIEVFIKDGIDDLRHDRVEAEEVLRPGVEIGGVVNDLVRASSIEARIDTHLSGGASSSPISTLPHLHAIGPGETTPGLEEGNRPSP